LTHKLVVIAVTSMDKYEKQDLGKKVL